MLAATIGSSSTTNILYRLSDNLDMPVLRLEHFHQSCSVKSGIHWTAVFLAFGGVSAQLQGLTGTCAFAEALPKAKNPRGLALHPFCQCSKVLPPEV
jgi:hypothetical protein